MQEEDHHRDHPETGPEDTDRYRSATPMQNGPQQNAGPRSYHSGHKGRL